MGACCSSEEPKRHKKKKKVPKGKKEEECCGSCFGSCCAGGGCACCGEDGEEQAINTGRILTLESMGFDQDGNLRHGFNRRDRLGEMQLIIGAEQQVKKKETEWAIVDATWLYQWLAYVNCKDGSVPAPGPCHNFRLVRQHEDGVYYPRLGLVMEKNEKMGDYRKISIKSWQILKELYVAFLCSCSYFTISLSSSLSLSLSLDMTRVLTISLPPLSTSYLSTCTYTYIPITINTGTPLMTRSSASRRRIWPLWPTLAPRRGYRSL